MLDLKSPDGENVVVEVHFKRAELRERLSPATYDPAVLVSLFSEGILGMTPPIYERSGHVGCRSSADHAFKVLMRYEEYYSHLPLPAEIDPNLFRVILILHDIGYPLTGRYGQHDYTAPMARSVLESLDFSDSEIKVALALISEDPLGHYILSEPGFEQLEDAMRVIHEQALIAGMSFKDFFELLVIFYTCDASSYSHLSKLFDFDIENRTIRYTNTIVEAKMRCSVEYGIRSCREALLPTK